MKKILLLALFVVLFFACSNDGLDVKIERPVGNVFCFVQEQGKCHDISADVCVAIGGEERESCVLEKSSSSDGGDGSSSSDGGDGSSSSVEDGDSSSSVEGGDSSSSVEDGDSSSSVEDGDSSSSVEDGDSSSSVEGGDSSSSVEGGDSSSSDEDGSSSSVVVSSSSSNSVPAPQTSGTFIFRNFDYSSSSSKIYFLRTNNMYESTTASPTGTGKLYNTLAITNATAALCGNITTEVTGDVLSSMPKSQETAATVNSTGEIIVKAVATCNGTKVVLASDTATVVPDQTLSDCVLPTYVYRNEPVRDLVTVENNYGRCANVTYSSSSYPNSASSTARNFSTRASCGGVSKECSGSIIVASYYVDFVKEDTHYPVANRGTTVIKMPEKELEKNNRLGCEYTGSNYEKPNIVFSVTVNGIKSNSIGSQNHWTNSAKFLTDYTTNGNRVLFETQNEGLECASTYTTDP